jgi:hypothetical protein
MGAFMIYIEIVIVRVNKLKLCVYIIFNGNNYACYKTIRWSRRGRYTKNIE